MIINAEDAVTPKSEFASGWLVVVGTFLGLAVSASAIPFYTTGMFMQPLQADMDWGSKWIAFVASMFSLTIALASPIAGVLVDRFGIVRPALVGYLVMVAAYFGLSRLGSSPYHYLLLQLAIALIGSTTSPVSFLRAVNQMFVRHKGLALGLGYSGLAVTATLAPSLVEKVIRTAGWRQAYLQIALVIAVIAPIALLAIWLGQRHVRSGKVPNAVSSELQPGDRGWHFLRTKAFILCAGAFLILAISIGGYVIHLPAILAEVGIDTRRAAAIQGSLGLAILIGRVVTGALVDRLFAPYVLCAFSILTGAGLVLLAYGGSGFVLPAALLIGLSIGAEGDVVSYLTARYFGIRHYGRVYGCLYAVFAIGLGTSPMAIGAVAAVSSYHFAIIASAGLLMAAAGLFALLPAFPKTAHLSDSGAGGELSEKQIEVIN
ncbi:MAG: MFS transporter [Sphingorhabdus sp.]